MIDRIETALNESRILVLVAQVLLGFQLQAPFQPGFAASPLPSRWIHLSGTACLLLALLLLLTPVPRYHFHQRGRLDRFYLRFLCRIMTPALLPFALALGANFYLVAARTFSGAAAVAWSIAATLTALASWYGLELHPMKRAAAPSGAESPEPTPLEDRIRFVLTEARVVLPGAQALLGFQFAAFFASGFETLDRTAREVHFAALAAIALSTILLMAPPAYHRIVEQGQESEALCAFASRMVLWAMVLLALGIAGSVFVCVDKVLGSAGDALAASGLTLLLFWGGWFGLARLRRARRSPTRTRSLPAG